MMHMGCPGDQGPTKRFNPRTNRDAALAVCARVKRSAGATAFRTGDERG